MTNGQICSTCLWIARHQQLFNDDWNFKLNEDYFLETLLLLNPKVMPQNVQFNVDEAEERKAAKLATSKIELEDEVAVFVPWQAVNDGCRLEMAGDSALVVNWTNGHWPIKNRWYGEIVDGCVGRLADLWSHGVRPRCEWLLCPSCEEEIQW